MSLLSLGMGPPTPRSLSFEGRTVKPRPAFVIIPTYCVSRPFSTLRITHTSTSFIPRFSRNARRTFAGLPSKCHFYFPRYKIQAVTSHMHQSDAQPNHSHCHSTPVLRNPSHPIFAVLARIASLRSSIVVAITSAVLLFVAAIVRLSRISYPLATNLPLIGTLLLSGLPALSESTLSLLNDRSTAFSVDVLMTLAAVISVCTGAFFEAALLTTLFATSLASENFVTARARAQLDALRRSAPDTALKLDSPTDTPVQVPLNSIRPDDLLLVQVGQIAPCDGTVVHNSVLVSQAHLTGESVPICKSVGDDVYAGVRPVDAPLYLRVSRVGDESFLTRVAKLVTVAEQNRPKMVRFFDKFGSVYTRCVIIASVTLAIVLPFLTFIFPAIPRIPFVGRSGSIARAIGFLVVLSPCALLVGAPVAYTAALSAFAKRGILVKGGARAIDAASRTAHVVFDKTGTLTTGQLNLTSVHTLSSYTDFATVSLQMKPGNSYLESLERRRSNGLPKVQVTGKVYDRVVAAAAALERGAVHPIADAVRKTAHELDIQLPTVSNAQVISGEGVRGLLTFDNGNGAPQCMESRLGKPSFILGTHGENFNVLSKEAAYHGETVSVLEVGDERYVLRMMDDVRPEAKEVIQKLKDLDMDVTVLTGDANGAANFVGDAVGGGVTVVSNATPEEKMECVARMAVKLQAKGKGAAMVGDGVNDGAALASANVGIAFGISNMTAVDAAEVVVVQEDLRLVSWFLEKARRTESIVKQNVVIALTLMVASSLACLYSGVPLWLAVTLHEGGTIAVGINGLRLLRDR